MGRKPRVEYYGALYHIIHKGKSEIFIDEEDKIALLGILGEVKETSDFFLLAYCILDDQYNLVIKTHNIGISKVIQRVNILYAKYFNLKYGTSGSPFSGRYKSIIIENESSAINLIRFVHNIPLHEYIIASMDEYKWSSDVFYRVNMDGVVNIEYILDIFSDERYSAIDKYINLMNSSDGEYEIKAPNLDEILSEVCNNDLDFNLIKQGSKKTYLMEYKKRYIYKCKELGFENFDIGENIGISERSVRKYLLRN